jgi:hypothetical protein
MERKANVLAIVLSLTILGTLLFPSIGIVRATTDAVPPEGIGGCIKDAVTQDPLVGVSVSGGGVQATTDTSGNYWLEIEHYGTFTITANKNGFQETPGSATINMATGYGTCNLNMNHANGLYGRVYDLNNNKIGGADVRAELPPYGVYNSATTDSNGFYYIPAVHQYDDVTVQTLATKTGYWANLEGWDEINYAGQTSQNLYMKSDSIQTIILAGVFVNRNGFTDSHLTIPNAQCSYATSYIVTTGWSGQAVYGYGSTTTLSTGSDTILNQAIDSSHTGLEIYGTVEITGVTQGWPGHNYQELNTYVLPNSLHAGSLLLTTPDTMSDPKTNYQYVGPGITSHTIGGSETSMVCTTNNYNIQTQLGGQPVTLTVTRSTTSTNLTACQLTLSNTDSIKTLKADYKFEASNPTYNVLIMHVWYDAYS